MKNFYNKHSHKAGFAIFFLVLFAPFGIYLIFKNKHFKNKTRYIVSAVALVWMSFIIIDGQPTEEELQAEEQAQEERDEKRAEKKEKKEAEKAEEKAAKEKEKADKKQAKEDEEQAKIDEVKAEKKAEEKAKKDEEEKKKKEKERKANMPIDEKMVEDVEDIKKAELYEGELSINYEPDTLWNENSLFRVVHDSFKDVKLAFEDNKLDSVTVLINVEMTDNKGNTNMKPVITYRYTRADFEELDYENFLDMSVAEEWRVLNEAEAYFISPGIRKNLKSKYTDNLR